jgi:large subunit ribosomal protein L29
MRKQTGQVEKTHELRTLRKDIARLETIQNQKKNQAPAAA